jgi:hypothetical protein
MTNHVTPDRVRELEIENAILVDALRAHLGVSSTQLLVSTFGGDPIGHGHPFDEWDVQGLTETLNALPEPIRERARPVYEEQVRIYREREATRS